MLDDNKVRLLSARLYEKIDQIIEFVSIIDAQWYWAE